jgi:hypothetical protein
MKRRTELPRYKKGLVCQQFLTTGHCNLFNKYGRCSLDHPQNVHTIVPPVRRCSQCTLVWPCNHCSFSSARRELEDALNLLKTKFTLLYQIALPAPPLALTSHLVGSPSLLSYSFSRIHPPSLPPSDRRISEFQRGSSETQRRDHFRERENAQKYRELVCLDSDNQCGRVFGEAEIGPALLL